MIPTREKIADFATWPSLTTFADLLPSIWGVTTLHVKQVRFANHTDSTLFTEQDTKTTNPHHEHIRTHMVTPISLTYYQIMRFS